jgi:hypothetical protein
LADSSSMDDGQAAVTAGQHQQQQVQGLLLLLNFFLSYLSSVG